MSERHLRKALEDAEYLNDTMMIIQIIRLLDLPDVPSQVVWNNAIEAAAALIESEVGDAHERTARAKSIRALKKVCA